MNYRETAKAIQALNIQGAQRIALSGAKSLLSCKGRAELRKAVKLLKEARPTEPCLRNALTFCAQSKNSSELKRKLKEIETIFKDANHKISLYGSRRIKRGNIVFTHCHSSTVVGILLHAKKRKSFSVHNTETRPFFQGRMTAKELARSGIKVTHFVDSAARLAIKGADMMLIGSDAITSDGFAINKIGSEMFAELAALYEIPVFVCTFSWKYDPRTQLGFDEVLESRFEKEVWAKPPKGVKISNVVFEKIHPRLITGIISEFGITTVAGFLETVKHTYQWLS